MAPRAALILLLFVLAIATKSSAGATNGGHWGLTRFASDVGGLEAASRACDGVVGDCVDEEEEMGMESESARRSLRGRAQGRFISYGALSKNRVPCNRRGHSYYNCRQRGRANPYRRGCSVITRCARILK